MQMWYLKEYICRIVVFKWKWHHFVYNAFLPSPLACQSSRGSAHYNKHYLKYAWKSSKMEDCPLTSTELRKGLKCSGRLWRRIKMGRNFCNWAAFWVGSQLGVHLKICGFQKHQRELRHQEPIKAKSEPQVLFALKIISQARTGPFPNSLLLAYSSSSERGYARGELGCE